MFELAFELTASSYTRLCRLVRGLDMLVMSAETMQWLGADVLRGRVCVVLPDAPNYWIGGLMQGCLPIESNTP